MSELPDRHAAVIGINAYSHGVAPLRSAVGDARAVAKALELDHGYSAVHLLLDAEATREGILRLLEVTLRRDLGPDSGVVIYYAGHGIAEEDDSGSPQGFLVPQDARLDDKTTWLSMDRLRQALGLHAEGAPRAADAPERELPCGHLLLVLDCCYAATVRWTSTRGMTATGRPLYDSQYYRYLLGTAWQVLTSASHDEKALDVVRDNRGQEGAERHSPFAGALLRGLDGDADSSRGRHDADGVMTATELLQYVFAELVPPEEDWPQTPGLWPLKPDNTGEFIFLSPRQKKQTVPDPPIEDANNPWPGLSSYGEREAPLFCGRERVIEELVERLQNPSRPLLAVVGTSGSGKSSVVRAGLLPRLRQPPEASGEDAHPWTIVEAALDGDPLGQLGKAVNRLGEGPRKLLFIDPFDPLLKAGQDTVVVADFLDRLRQLMTGAEPVRVLITLRLGFEWWLRGTLKDFLAPASGDLRPLGPYRLPAPTVEELRQIVEQPATARAVYFDPAEQVGELIGEVTVMPEPLPLLSVTLATMYRRACNRRRAWGSRDRALNREDYRAVGQAEEATRDRRPGPEVVLGGVAGAIHVLADQLLEEAGSRLAPTVRRVLLRMVSFEGWRGARRRRISRRELVYAVPEEQKRVEEVLDALTAAHLLVADRRYLEPAHDTLIRQWPPMKSWLDESGDDQLLLRSVWSAAETWRERGRTGEWLWGDDPRLPQLRVMSGELNRLESEFLGASLDAARVALARERMSEDPTQAALLLRDLENVDTGGAVSAMLEVLGQPLAAVVLSDGNHAVFSTDGTKILTVSEDATVRVWNADGSGPPVVLRGHQDWVASGMFNTDGTKVLTASADGTARVWNADGSRGPVVLRGHEDWVVSAVFNATGTKVVTGSNDRTARVWNADGSGVPIVLRGHEGWLKSAVFNSAGTEVLTVGDRTARVWNVDGSGVPVVLRGHEDWMATAVFNFAGTKVLTSSYDGTARIWNVDGSGDPVVLRGHEGSVWSAVFDADDTKVLTCSGDKTARVWNADGAGVPVVLRGHDDWVMTARFNVDGTRLATASVDGTARVWNVDGSGEPLILRGHRDVVYSAAFNADGSRIITAGEDAKVRVWSADPREPVVLRGHTAGLWSASFNAAGTKVVTASYDGTARVWTVDGPGGRTSGEPVVLRGHRDWVWGAAFNGDGTRVVTASEDRTARVWNADGSGRPLVLRGHRDRVETAVFNTTGTKIVTTSRDGTARVWNVDRLTEPVVLQGHQDWLWGASFNAAGNKVATASRDGTARVWNVDGSGKPLVLAHQANVWSVAFNTAGTRAVTASDDGTARVWSIDGDRVIGEPVVLRGHETGVRSAVFNTEGTSVLTAGGETARLWNADGSGQPVVFRGHLDEVVSAAFNAAGTRVLTVSVDGTARVWNVTGPDGRSPGEPVVLRHRKERGDLSAAFDAAGTRVVTASWDGTARVWTIDAAILQATLRAVTSACLDPEFRVRYLNESPEAAWEKHAECERLHGRPARHDKAKPSSTGFERPLSPLLGRRLRRAAGHRLRR